LKDWDRTEKKEGARTWVVRERRENNNETSYLVDSLLQNGLHEIS